MSFFPNLSIRHKQLVVILLTGFIALLLAGTGVSIYGIIDFRRALAENMSILTDAVGRDYAVAINANDPKVAGDALQALQAEPSVDRACVYDRQGKIFAAYRRDGRTNETVFPRMRMELAGSEFTDNHLHVFRMIRSQGRPVGAIYLESNLDELPRHLRHYAEIMTLVFACAMLAAIAMTSHLNRHIYNPILRLADLTRSVAQDRNYSLRAQKTGNDEVGGLVDSFNIMLAQIEAQNVALQVANDNLERRVEQRTKDLRAQVAERRQAEIGLENSNSLLTATLDSIADAILALDLNDNVISYNEQFISLWDLPVDMLARRKGGELLQAALAKLKNPDDYLRLVRQWHEEPEAESFHLVELKDGRTLERYVRPQMIGEECVGIVINFRDITERKRADEALRESQSLYLSLVEQMPTGVYRKNKEGRFVFVNSWFCRHKGLTPDQVLGLTSSDLADAVAAMERPDLAESNKYTAIGDDHHKSILETGTQFEVEEAYTGRDGRAQHLRVIKSPVYGPDGAIIGSQGLMFDITALKEAEARLAQTSYLMDILLTTSDDYIYFKDRESRFIRYSASVAALDRQRRGCYEDLTGKTDIEISSEEHGRRAYEDEQRIIQTGEPIIGQLETEVWPDGRMTWALTSKMPLRNAKNEIIGTFGISKDITAVKKAEARLAETSRLMDTLLETSADCIYFKDRDSRFIRSSASMAAAFGVKSPAELVGKRDLDFYTSEHAVPALEDEQKIMQTGEPIVGKTEKETWPDGRVTWALTTKMPLRNAKNEIIGTFGISKDITPLKEAEARLKEVHHDLVLASRRAGMADVATSVLHNVGNVLNSVNTSASVIAGHLQKSRVSGIARVVSMFEEHQADLAAFLADTARREQLLNYLRTLNQHLESENAMMTGEAQELAKNIEHIKEIVTMQQSYARVTGVQESHSVPSLVEDALRMNTAALERHDVRIVRDFKPTADILVDKHKVLQVLINLISNAKYAMAETSATERVLTLGINPVNGSAVSISVSDRGMGIAPENMTRIFSLGFTTRDDGHGFGLHSGFLAAREMGGELRVQSDGPGCGATFTLELPALPQ